MWLALYTWDDTNTLFRTLEKKILEFSTQYGNYNVARVDISPLDEKTLRVFQSEVEWRGLFLEQRLILLTGLSLLKGEDEAENGKRAWGNEKQYITQFQHLLEDIPEHITVILILPKLDARMTVTKYIESHAEKHIFSPTDTLEKNTAISSAFRDLLLRRTEKTPAVRMSLFEQVSLYTLSHPLTADVIDFLCPPSNDDIIFQAIDAIAGLQIDRAHHVFTELMKRENPKAVYASLITNLRTRFFILTLRKYGASDDTLASLGIHPFVLQKTRGNEAHRKKLSSLLISLIESERDQKSGKWFSDPELWILMAIDRGLFGLQKEKNDYTTPTIHI